MWRPSSWTDLEGLVGVAEETPSLDFKRELGKNNEETAKDIAAMTVNEGVLLYGVDEDRKTRVATDITTVPLAGVEEKLRLVAGAHIQPTPDFDVEIIASPSDATKGVVAVLVPASSLAPHQVNRRYPCRRGTVTEYLDEREVERLYRQRQELSGRAASVGEILGDYAIEPLDGFQVGNGTGTLTLVVRPAGTDISHPAAAWQRSALQEAVRGAAQRQGSRVANSSLIKTFRVLREWNPDEARGWVATNAGSWPTGTAAPKADPQMLIGASLAYPATLSFRALFGLVREGPNASVKTYLTAREADVIYELVAMLAVAGEYLTDVLGSGHLLVAASLSGFQGARSSFATGTSSTADLDAPGLPAATDGVENTARTSAVEMRDTPERVARLLVERWLPSFYEDDRDLFETIVPGD
ncbi:MAG: helix-turn-helix domain-containing protein [Solirubrobacteraceae bacterium]